MKRTTLVLDDEDQSLLDQTAASWKCSQMEVLRRGLRLAAVKAGVEVRKAIRA